MIFSTFTDILSCMIDTSKMASVKNNKMSAGLIKAIVKKGI